MSSEDEPSSRALASFGCAHLGGRDNARVLVGGLGMGFTLREALDRLGATNVIEVVELVAAIVEWNRSVLGSLAGDPLCDPRTHLRVGDVAKAITSARNGYDAILLDVDNGPDALAHEGNQALYGVRGIERARAALVDGGVFAVWSFSDDPGFSLRLEAGGFHVSVKRVAASRKGRGKNHFVWIATKTG